MQKWLQDLESWQDFLTAGKFLITLFPKLKITKGQLFPNAEGLYIPYRMGK